MKIVFVYKAVESFGLEYLSAALKKNGHKVELAFDPDLFGEDHYLYNRFLNRLFSNKRKVVDNIISKNPDVIGFSVPTVYYRWALDIAESVKKKINRSVVFGGIHPTSVPEEVLKNKCVDYVVTGEADRAFVELVESLEKGGAGAGILNVWTKDNEKIIPQKNRPLISDLDSLPVTDKTLFETVIPFSYLYKTAIGRGCPYNCTFCCHSVLKEIYKYDKNYCRMRSPEKVIEELVSAKKRYKFKLIHFDDDVMTVNKKWLAVFMKLYKKNISVPFTCVSHPLCIDEERAGILKQNGCILLEMGIQSLKQETRKKYLNRTESNEDIARAVSACEKKELNFQVDHILGLPGETESDYIEASEFYLKWKLLKRIECFNLTYYPETHIMQYINDIDNKKKKQINEGREKHFFYGGSVSDKDRFRTAVQFKVVFKLLTILPRPMIECIIKNKIYRLFHLIPGFIITFLEAVNCMVVRDKRPLFYLGYYYRHLLGRF